MNILNRYIAKTLLLYASVVMTVLVSVFAFFKFLEEVDNVGVAGYELSEALIYIGLLLPSMVYVLSSLIILLGCIIGLGNLAASSELVAMRSLGISTAAMTRTTLTVGVLLVVVTMLIGEFIVPVASHKAKEFRTQAMQQGNIAPAHQGFWLKDNQKIIRIENNIDGLHFKNVTFVKLKQPSVLDGVLFSPTAVFNGSTITLDKTQHTKVDARAPIAKITQKHYDTYSMAVSFDQDFVSLLKKDPDELTLWQLDTHIKFLTRNHLSSDIYEVEFYRRLTQPLTLIAMIMLAIPFVFGSLRNASLGRKIFLGVAMSLFFELISRMSSVLSLSFNYNYLLSALLPATLVLSIVLVRMWINAKSICIKPTAKALPLTLTRLSLANLNLASPNLASLSLESPSVFRCCCAMTTTLRWSL